MQLQELRDLLTDLRKEPQEQEWLEFKHNYQLPDDVGKRIAALANSARLKNKDFGYLVFGVEDGTHRVVGTTYDAKQEKKGNEDLEPWLRRMITPDLRFEIFVFQTEDGYQISLFKIPSTYMYPTTFQKVPYIRIGSHTKPLAEYPAEEDALRYLLRTTSFEQEVAKDGLSNGDIASLLDIQTYFDKLGLPQPETTTKVVEKFITEGLTKAAGRYYGITNLGALLFAKDLRQFEGLESKAIRVVQYESVSKRETKVDHHFYKGYALGFTEVANYVYALLPAKERFEGGIRKRITAYPEKAVRELIANALVHQDFYHQGPILIELFTDRIEISNPGTPLIETDRFIDTYSARNEKLADMMRRLGICERLGSGFDKVLEESEYLQLPPVEIIQQPKHTIVVLYSKKDFQELSQTERIETCYQHTCVNYILRRSTTNESLRDRFGLSTDRSSTISRIITAAKKAGRIKDKEPNMSKKNARYVPYWA